MVLDTARDSTRCGRRCEYDRRHCGTEQWIWSKLAWSLQFDEYGPSSISPTAKLHNFGSVYEDVGGGGWMKLPSDATQRDFEGTTASAALVPSRAGRQSGNRRLPRHWGASKWHDNLLSMVVSPRHLKHDCQHDSTEKVPCPWGQPADQTYFPASPSVEPRTDGIGPADYIGAENSTTIVSTLPSLATRPRRELLFEPVSHGGPQRLPRQTADGLLTGSQRTP